VLGLGTSLSRGKKVVRTYVKDGLKLYMPYRGSDASEVKFVGTGSTSFDGSNDYVDTNSTFQSTFQGSFTISAWIKPTDGNPSADEIYIGTNNADDTDTMYLYVRDGGELGFYYETNNNGDLTLTNSVLFTDGQQDWCHVCTVVDDTLNQVSLYFNGVSQTLNGSYDGDISSITNSDFQSSGTTPNLFIGAYSNNGTSSQEYKGSIKNVAIWSRALTATEVQNVMYKTYVNVSGRLASGLVSWWALDASGLGTNLLSNGDMETGSVWSAYGANETLEFTSDKSYSGSQSLHFIVGAQNRGTYSPSFNITSGETIQVSAWVYSVGNTYIRMGMSNTTDSLFSVEKTVTADTWTNITHTYTCNSTAGSYVGFFSSGSGFEHYVDDVTVKKVSVEDLKSTNHGAINGATVDEDLYGGDTPVIPRAIDNARTVQADAIGAGSASFDGVDDNILASITPFLTNDFSVTAWIKPDTFSNYDVIIDTRDIDGSNTDGFFYGFDSAGKLYCFYNGVFLDNTGAVTLGNFHMVALTKSGDDWKSYVDGVLVASASRSGFTGADTGIGIGGARFSTYYFDGNICQVGIWSSALTQATIQSVMEKTYEELIASEKTNLVSYWALDVDASDSHGDNDGTLT